MKLNEAMPALRAGNFVARSSWPRTRWLARINDHDPFVLLHDNGETRSWRPSSEDLAAEDWFAYPNEDHAKDWFVPVSDSDDDVER